MYHLILILITLVSVSPVNAHYAFPSQRQSHKGLKVQPLHLVRSNTITQATMQKTCTLSQFKDNMQPEVTIINRTDLETHYIQILFTIAARHHKKNQFKQICYAGNFHIEPSAAITVTPQSIETKISKFVHPTDIYASDLSIGFESVSAHLHLAQSAKNIFMIVKEQDKYVIKPFDGCSK